MKRKKLLRRLIIKRIVLSRNLSRGHLSGKSNYEEKFVFLSSSKFFHAIQTKMFVFSIQQNFWFLMSFKRKIYVCFTISDSKRKAIIKYCSSIIQSKTNKNWIFKRKFEVVLKVESLLGDESVQKDQKLCKKDVCVQKR